MTGLRHYEDMLLPDNPNQKTLDEFLLAADCASCHKPVVKADYYIIAGNPGVTWKFHYHCWQKLPKKFRRGLDVYGGVKNVQR